jgi:hypothetical protein
MLALFQQKNMLSPIFTDIISKNGDLRLCGVLRFVFQREPIKNKSLDP